jgi:plastocyanin
MIRRINDRKLKAEIARLRDLDLPDLRAVWQKHYGTTAPKTLRRKILILSIAWRIQADVAGGLKPATRRYLRQVAAAARSGTVVRPPSAGRIKPGTKLMRVWQDKTHTVTALAEGFEWQGSRYRSLSEIARTITGTRWNGLVFFGVKSRTANSKVADRIRPTRRESDNA